MERKNKLQDTSGEGYVDTKILELLRVGWLAAGLLQEFFNETVLLYLGPRVQEMFDYSG